MTVGKDNRLREPNQLAARTEFSNLNAAAGLISTNVDARICARGMISLKNVFDRTHSATLATYQ